MKKGFAILFAITILLLSGCTEQTDVHETEPSTTQAKIEVKDYPGDSAIATFGLEHLLSAELFDTSAEENGKEGVLYEIYGTVEEYIQGGTQQLAYWKINTHYGDVFVQDILYFFEHDPEQTYSATELDQMRAYYPIPEVGEFVHIYAQYIDTVDGYGGPLFSYGGQDYFVKAVMASEDADKDQTSSSVEATDVIADGSSEHPYEPGMYKVGSDLPAGEYLFIPTDSISGYVCASVDSNQDDIVENENINGPFFMTVADGQYLQTKRCVFVIAQEYTLTINEDGTFEDGMYRVGEDIPAGEYKLNVTEDIGGYWCIYSNSEIPLDIIDNQNFEGSTYVTVREGQYFQIKRCIATPVK